MRIQALLAGILARQLGYLHPGAAALAATLSGIGLLAQQAQHGKAWEQLFADTSSLNELLQAEQTLFATHHVEVAISILDQLQLDSSLIDCARYQAATMLEIRDASQLVKVVWLARFLSEQLVHADEAALGNAHRVLGLSVLSLQAIMKKAVEQISDELRQTNLQQLLPGTGPQTEQAGLITLALENQQRQLRQLILQQSVFTAMEQELPASPLQMQDLLVRLLRQAGITGGFILLVEDADSGYCTIDLEHDSQLADAGFSIRCEPGRSALATALLSQTLTTLARDSRHLAVVDRQFIQALGNTGLICEPVRVGKCRAALLLVDNPAYVAQASLRQVIRQKLAHYLEQKHPQAEALPDSTLRYRQQVRETVHEINNPLSIIRNYLQLFAVQQQAGGIAPETLKQLDSEIDRMAGLLASMRDVTPAKPATSSSDLNEVVTTFGAVLNAAFAGNSPNTIALEVQCSAIPLQVQASPDLLKQVITNLVKNAAEAFTSGGVITLTTAANVYFMEQLYMQLVVADNGPGIQASRLLNLFTQGSSSKGAMHSGAGLAIVKRLVDEIQGKISCQSDSNGTAFSILIPQAQ